MKTTVGNGHPATLDNVKVPHALMSVTNRHMLPVLQKTLTITSLGANC